MLIRLYNIDSPLLGDAELKKIADKHSVSPATVLISWSVNKGIVVLPKSVTPARMSNITPTEHDIEGVTRS